MNRFGYFMAFAAIMCGIYLILWGASEWGDRNAEKYPNGVVFLDKASGLPMSFANSYTEEHGDNAGMAHWEGDTRPVFEHVFCTWNVRPADKTFKRVELNGLILKSWRKEKDEYRRFGDYIAQLSQTCY